MVFIAPVLAAALSAASLASAHPHFAPGDPAIAKRAAFQATARRSLADCQGELMKKDGVYEQGIARREAFANMARDQMNIRRDSVAFRKRDLVDVLATNHHSNLTDVTLETDPSTLFSGNSSCVLAPETTEGPYCKFYVDGEYVRFDLREDQEGVPLYVDFQLIDVNTCLPVPDVYVDYWHCNATGVYSGVIASSNGNSADETNVNATWLRGLAPTDENGVAQWLSIFPGHYTGRTAHIHVAAHQNGTLFDNGTYVSDTVSHVGQLFFDQSTITEVELLAPYNTNTQELTTNEEDGIMEQEAADIDPVMQYVYLGDSAEDGFVMWAAMGIDTSVYNDISAAASYYAEGGVMNPDSGMGGGPGGPPGGDIPSGSAPPPSASASATASA
ncbi:aromatic compound dioxygenase [Cylindrobasidium torrendii FP15055 ss-10]|uniref:Aromatic compound dioxygenase n=1 Tax=Cylindrobasidium torrendii FP15055 ss-10 TaxID=1314674 RepID=A0A0D7BGS1_9AGAR|nr:aromatic compound dioxygenase [Cylindrobasidium torrendii FP15055 ss-10]